MECSLLLNSVRSAIVMGHQCCPLYPPVRTTRSVVTKKQVNKIQLDEGFVVLLLQPGDAIANISMAGVDKDKGPLVPNRLAWLSRRMSDTVWEKG